MTPNDLFSDSSDTPADEAATNGVAAVDGIRVGVGGWTYVPWRKNFYPDGLVQRRELEYASRRLSTIEINGTYYGTQKPDIYARWAAETPAGFLFSAKAPRRIMQSRVLARTGGQVDDFLGGITALGDRLGPIVWQFDAGITLDRDDFAAFLDLLPATVDGHALRHVLDVRDPDFMDADALALIRRHAMATVFTDSTRYPSFADVTGDFVYARLMRSQSEIATGYAPADLERWAARARCWADGGEPDDLPRIVPPVEPAKPHTRPSRDVFVYFISAAKERNPAAAMALIARLRR
jgi:uncharacterized protein YecE (DUF72 family)